VVVEYRPGLAPATMSCFHSITDGMAANELCTAHVFAGGCGRWKGSEFEKTVNTRGGGGE
jgi:hypothetical protein